MGRVNRIQDSGFRQNLSSDETTDRTTSHLTNPAKDAGQVIGYSHSTRLSAEELLAGHPKDGSQVVGYRLSTEELLMELLAIPLGYQKTAAKWLVISNQKTVAKWLVIAIPLSRQKTATKWLVMLRCVKNFLLTYSPYAARLHSNVRSPDGMS